MANVLGHGTTITFGTSAFTATLTNLSGPNMSIDDVDVSHMGTTLRVKEYTPGMLEPGEISCDVLFDPSQLKDAPPFSDNYIASGWSNAASETESITIQWPPAAGETTGAKTVFDGYIKSIEPTTPLDGVVTASMTVKVSGIPVFTAAS